MGKITLFQLTNEVPFIYNFVVGKAKLDEIVIQKIIQLRKQGHSTRFL